MSHDELLENIKDAVFHTETAELFNQGGWLAGTKALLAVVELHKPNYGLCKACTTSVVLVPYPCRTIEAVEKELV